MAVKRESRRDHNPVQVSSEEALEKADQLAPLEEQKGRPLRQNSDGEGVILVDTGDLKLPSDFTEKDEKSRLFGIEPITAAIIVFALAFIAFIAYLISIETPKAKEESIPNVEQLH
ncbi:MAG TPA: hypothetical protein VM095_02115 [Pyrinomonadaceae bacterium]|nr:hypothetical protein [Pyrinomonadaceae bacterium]